MESNQKLSDEMVKINNETKHIILTEINLTNTNVNNLQQTVNSLPTKDWMESLFERLHQTSSSNMKAPPTNTMEEDKDFYIRNNDLNKRKSSHTAEDKENNNDNKENNNKNIRDNENKCNNIKAALRSSQHP